MRWRPAGCAASPPIRHPTNGRGTFMGLVTTLEYAEDGQSRLQHRFGGQLRRTEFRMCCYLTTGCRGRDQYRLQRMCLRQRWTARSRGGVSGNEAVKSRRSVGRYANRRGMLPQYCAAALRLFERTNEVYPNHAVSLTGHSLGGGVAQVIGHWTGAPFVTFNAPGMWGDIQRSKFLATFPFDAWRSIKGTFNRSPFAKQMASTGRNFRNVLDPVSGYGMHYGPVTRFWGLGDHAMDDVLERIRKSRWADVNPFDPAYKEWGEL